MKKNIIIYSIVLILACALTGTITYIFMDKKGNSEVTENNKPEEKDPILKDGVKLLRTYQESDEIIQEYEIVLNGKNKNLKLEFNYEKDDTFEVADHIVTGSYNQKNIIYSDIKRDDYQELSTGEIKIIKTYNKEDIFNINIIKKNMNEKNFQIIKGEDNKKYLLLHPCTNEGEASTINPTVILVFNDELELISENIISKNESIDEIVRNGFTVNEYIGNTPCEVEKIYDKYKYVKIEDDKIYFLYPKLNSDLSGGNLEERVYTINNSKLEYKVINTYKINSICQQIW